MYYIIYKITNKTNGKIYIGSHKTSNLDDSYMGSGKYLKRAIEKHGLENFTKEILFVYDNPAEMYAKEAEIVNDEFLAEANTYNLKVGGFGGWDYLNSNKFDNKTHSIEHMTMMSHNAQKNNPNGCFRKAHTDSSKEKMSKAHLQQYKDGRINGFAGKKHTEEYKIKIGKIIAKKQAGSGNSQYGTKWIHSPDLRISKRIEKTANIPNGWLLGRKIKW